MPLDFCRRQSRPVSVIMKVKTQHLTWIYEFRRGFLWSSVPPNILRAVRTQDFWSSKQKSLSNGFIKGWAAGTAVLWVATLCSVGIGNASSWGHFRLVHSITIWGLYTKYETLRTMSGSDMNNLCLCYYLLVKCMYFVFSFSTLFKNSTIFM